MTSLVVRTLDESSAHLFDTMPDPLGFGDRHRSTRYRPDWRRIAVRDGRTVARAAWWGGPEDHAATRDQLVRRGRGRGGGRGRAPAHGALADRRTRNRPALRLAHRPRQRAAVQA